MLLQKPFVVVTSGGCDAGQCHWRCVNSCDTVCQVRVTLVECQPLVLNLLTWISLRWMMNVEMLDSRRKCLKDVEAQTPQIIQILWNSLTYIISSHSMIQNLSVFEVFAKHLAFDKLIRRLQYPPPKTNMSMENLSWMSRQSMYFLFEKWGIFPASHVTPW